MLKKHLLLVLFLVSIFNATAQKVTLNFKNAKLKDIFSAINKQTGYTFSYSSQIINPNSTATINEKNIALKSALEKLLQNTKVNFEITDDQKVLLSQKSLLKTASSSTEKHLVKGIVKDTYGEPLPGASVVEKGTTNGTTTDFDGNFSLKVSKNATLSVSFIGFKTKEIAVNEQTNFEIQLNEEAGQLEEVVIIGYGSQSKSKVTGAISKLDSKELNKYVSSGFDQAILGRMGGVEISQNGRIPGSDSQITIRGVNTLTAGTNPLIVVDGVALSEGTSINSISPQDIETISVVKDAASASIYGSRAANGLILITTKKGKGGKLKVNFSSYTSVQQRSDNLKLINAYDAAKFFYKTRTNGYVSQDPINRNPNDNNEVRISKGASPSVLILDYTKPYLEGKKGLTNYDWLNGVYRNAIVSNYHLSVSGNTDKSDYYISLGYLDEEGILIGTGQKRYSSNIKFNSKISKNFNHSLTLNTSYTDLDITGDSGWHNYPPDPGAAFRLMWPFFSPYNKDGTFAISKQIYANTPYSGARAENIVAATLLTKNIEKRFRTFGNTSFTYSPIEGLDIKSMLGFDFRNNFNDYYQPSIIGAYKKPVENNTANSSETKTNVINYLWENTLDYKKSFANKHNFNFLIGNSYQEESSEATKISAIGIVDDTITNIGGGGSFSINANRYKWTQMSYFGRIQYDYDSRYLFSASIRSDGSSRFGKNSKWGTFKSLSAGWTISNESFFSDEGFINYIKLRGSWGETGNNQIGNYGSQSLIENDFYTIDGKLVLGSAPTTSPNANLSWETNTSKNIGVDLRFLDNKISLTTEYYITNTTDLLLKVPVPQQSGYNVSLQNIGEVQNNGFEFELSGNNFNIGNLNIGFHMNLSTNSNKVKALGNGQKQIISTTSSNITHLTKVGEEIAQFYTYDVIGVYKTQEEINNSPHLSGTLVGDYKIRDTNGDGKIDTNDRVALGSYNPDFTYAFGANLTFNNFDFSFTFNGIKGRKVLDDYTARGLENGQGFLSASQYYFDNFYDPVDNPNGFLAMPNANFSPARNATRMNSLGVTSGDYLRLRNIQLGYNFSDNTLDKIGLSKARIYLTANNLFTISKFRGVNSEGIRPSILNRGFIGSTTSIPRVFSVGLNINF